MDTNDGIPQDVIDRQVEVVTALQGAVLRRNEEDIDAEALANTSEALSHAVLGLSSLAPVPFYGSDPRQAKQDEKELDRA